MATHHDIRSTDPIPAPRGNIEDLTSRLRRLAIESISRDEGCSLEEAEQRLDTTPAPATSTPDEIAAQRREAQNRRVHEYVRELAMPVSAELLPKLVRGECERTRSAKEAADWMRSDRRVLVLVGDMGVGKTVAACLVACAFARRRKSVRYVREPLLVRWWHSTTLAHEQQVERLREVDLLIVDELGTTLSGNGERARDAIFGMVDDRIAERRCTVLIGNLTESDIGKRYGARLVDRLNEIGTIVGVTGESMRGRVAAKR